MASWLLSDASNLAVDEEGTMEIKNIRSDTTTPSNGYCYSQSSIQRLLLLHHPTEFQVTSLSGIAIQSMEIKDRRGNSLYSGNTFNKIEVPKEMAQVRYVRRWSRNGFWSGNGFCFDPVANSFTVANITLTCAVGEEETRAHIIQFSTATNSWTHKSMGVTFRIWERYISVHRSISCVNRYMHCRVAIFRDGKFSVADDMYILSYDMIGSIFERIEMPFPPIRHRVLLANCSGSLALFGEDDDAWVMNDCGGADRSWSKLVTCRRPSKVGPGVEVFIESNDELVIVREPRLSVFLEQCYSYSESLASLY